MTDEQEKLVEDNIGLVIYYINSRNLYDVEDVYSLLMKSLCVAASKYDPSIGVAFSTFACNKMKQDVSHYRRYFKLKNRDKFFLTSLEYVVSGENKDDLFLGDIIEDSNSGTFIQDVETMDILDRVLKKVNDRYRDPIRKVIFDDVSITEVIDKYGISRTAFYKHFNRFKQYCREEYLK